MSNRQSLTPIRVWCVGGGGGGGSEGEDGVGFGGKLPSITNGYKKIKGQYMNRSKFGTTKYMNESVFSKARYMNG